MNPKLRILDFSLKTNLIYEQITVVAGRFNVNVKQKGQKHSETPPSFLSMPQDKVVSGGSVG